MKNKTNFILFNPEEMRAESTGTYGHPLTETPNLDRLAEEGVTFEQCHTTHTVCSPSRCSLLTGWHPHVRGHRSLWNLLEPHEPNLFKYLAEEGYQIRWYGKNDAFSPEAFQGTVEETFPEAIDQAEREELKKLNRFHENPHSQDDPLYYSFLYEQMGKYEETRDFHLIKKAIDFLRSEPEEPFLLYLPISFSHPPYHAPKGFHDMYDPATLPPLRPVNEKGKGDFHQEIRRTRRLDQLSEEDFREINAKYLGMISYADALFGDLMESLEESGLNEDTAVFFYSDHGDWAGDYGLVEKWPSGLDDTLSRVPLVARIPEGSTGKTVKGQVQHFDIAPTVLELAGIEPSHSFFARSLLPELKGERDDGDRIVFTEGGYDLPHDEPCFEGRASSHSDLLDPSHIYYPKVQLQQDAPETVCRSVSIRTASHKLIYRTKADNELYDLDKDPQEVENLYDDPDYAPVVQRLERLLLNWYVETSDVTPWEENPRGFLE